MIALVRVDRTESYLLVIDGYDELDIKALAKQAVTSHDSAEDMVHYATGVCSSVWYSKESGVNVVSSAVLA